MPYRPSLRQLEYVVALAECGHFGKAARRCHVSQPTLSVQISGVEEGLGVQLFERTPSAVLLTPIGERFLHGARLTLAALNDLMDAVADDASSLGGLVKIGTPPSFGPYFLPTFLPPIHRTYPALKVHILEDRPAAIETAVAEGVLDCGIGPTCESPGLTAMTIGDEQLYLGVPADHRLATIPAVRVADLRGEHLLALGSGNRLLENVRHLAGASGAVIVDDYEGTSLDAIRQMISIGMGCSLFPELYARAEFRQSDDVKLISIEDWRETRAIDLYFRDNSGRKRLFETLADEARRAASALGLRDASSSDGDDS
ncbi:hydrogen peroxide-inducible genes activator [Aurantimonas sp. VKM B-3413]|uniref:hydrogen peroxide-inducible genes activator n=1 Tax=Aurantimonas sp. VKM B-3413 TaxID=2779401 RepID=UPI001E5AAD07|nr:hydrogen peroxide-inducible genes activator [Aurantimonas sp. VKM B-3413]MCB8839296.1 hydrogen peroxide-inducible genes activator [Aurantimonas sp. VKM B-3413]